MTEGEFREVVRAVNESLPPGRGPFGVEVEDFGWPAARASVTAGGVRLVHVRATGPGCVERALSGLAREAARSLGFPLASSYEEARLKIALAGAARRA